MNTNRLRPLSAPKGYLDAFPDEVYDTSDNTHLARFINALCGDAGVGSVRKQMLLGRLETSIETTHHLDLDRLYGVALNFPRLQSESYAYLPETNLLTVAQWQDIHYKDSLYRARVRDFLRAMAYGGTLEGIKLAARAALGVDCKVFESYKYFNAHGIDEGDSTTFGRFGKAVLGEVIVIPMVASLSWSNRRLIYMTTERVKPQDTTISVMAPSEFYPTSSSVLDEDRGVLSPVASSEYFYVKRMVTGRSDWPVDYAPEKNMWIQADGTQEAPVIAFGSHQEEVFDLTSLVSAVEASSQHVGEYTREQEEMFSVLASDDVRVTSLAEFALRDSSRKRISTSYYGGRR